MGRGEYSRTAATRAARASAVLAAVVASSAFGASLVNAADAVGAVRGVAPADQERFTEGGVLCSVGGVQRQVPLARVNDDYCDCDDGKDEPGTTACSHHVESVFYCHNDGFFPKHIHTSLLNDGVCDCCDGSDELDTAVGAARCVNRCPEEASEFRKQAILRLADVQAGYNKREEELKNIVHTHFAALKEKDALADKTLVSLATLKDRVEVHKAREERREKKMRLEAARMKQSAGDEASKDDAGASAAATECVPNSETGTTCENPQVNSEIASKLQEVDASDVAGQDVSIASDDLDHSATQSDAELNTHNLATMVELSDGTKLSLADYMRMDHAIKKLKGSSRTPDQRRREDFLGPLFNGDVEDRKRIGLYALRAIGIVASPLRLLIECVLYIPRLLWNIATSSVILKPYVEGVPSYESLVQSPSFRRLGDGEVYNLYKKVEWGSRVVWDAPIVAYQYLFPQLDLDLTLPEAESLRKVVKEIEDDMEKLRKEKENNRADLEFDYGPDRVFYALKDQCIEKQVEKYVYKVCAFKDVKQDYTNLGKWESWGKAVVSGEEKTDYNVMHFAQGLKCWNGPERSAKITIECGANNEIVSVDEPSTCVYEMKVRSHVACTADVLSKAEAEVAFWSQGAAN